MLENVLRLMCASPHHRTYTVETVMRCVAPPLDLGQHSALIRDGRLVAWASWAWMAPEKAEAFLNDDHAIRPHDWCAGERLVFMDFIAPYGHALKLYGQLRPTFKDVPAHIVPTASWTRFAKNGKQVRVKNGQ